MTSHVVLGMILFCPRNFNILLHQQTDWEMTTGNLSACIVLIYGLPASGKSLLTDSLVDCSKREADMRTRNWIAVHFDDYYPTDTRVTESDAKVHK